MQKKSFTLIELLIVVVIMGVIVIVGYPSYQSYLREARRQDAIQSILALQIKVEQQIAQNNSLPAVSGNFAAQDSQNALYTITYSQVNAALLTYQIVAVAKSGTSQVNDKAKTTSCSTITLLSTNEGLTPYECK